MATKASRTPPGGFVHRMMPPTDWACGEIPEACYDEGKTLGQIQRELEAVYLAPPKSRIS